MVFFPALRGMFKLFSMGLRLDVRSKFECAAVRSSYSVGEREVAVTNFEADGATSADLIDFIADLVVSVASATKSGHYDVLHDVAALIKMKKERAEQLETADN